MAHAVIVPTRERPSEIRRLLANLAEQTQPPDTVLVVDASESGETRSVVEHQNDRGPYEAVHLAHTANICLQKNAGLDAAAAELVSFFDDDVELERDYCARIVERFTADADRAIGAIGGTMNNFPRRHPVDRAVRKLFLVQSDDGRNRFLASGFPDPGRFSTETEVEFLATGAATFRNEAIGALRFDARRFSGIALGYRTGRGFSEDVGFSSDVGQRHRLIVLPSACFSHLPSPHNREDTKITQALYVFSLRTISDRKARSRAARAWALSGLGIMAAIQSLIKGDPGYLIGYRRGMRAPLVR